MGSTRIYTIINVGRISHWIGDLTRIKGMGFNAVQFLPLSRMGSSKSPYSISNHSEIDTSNLPEGVIGNGFPCLDCLVDTIGSYDMQAGFDLVPNHIAADSRVVTEHPEWIQKENGEFKNAGYWKDDEWIPWDDLFLLDYEQSRDGLWECMTNYALARANLAQRTNGILRLDNLHSTHEEFGAALFKRLKNEYPDIKLYGEVFATHDKKLKLFKRFNLDRILDPQWDSVYTPNIRHDLEYIHSDNGLSFFMPLTSQDSGTVIQQYGCVSSTIPRYIIAALFSCGSTGIVQGDEYGATDRQFIGVPQLKKGDSDFSGFFWTVNQILEKNQLYHQKGNLTFVDNGHHAILAAVREFEDSYSLLMVNLDTNNPQSINIPNLHNRLQENTYLLKPCEARVILLNNSSSVEYQFNPDGSIELPKELRMSA